MKVLRRAIVFVIFLFLAYSLVKNAFEFRHNFQVYDSRQSELKAAEAKKAQLMTQKTLKTSPREIEKTIRNQLNLLRENEVAVIVPPPSPTPTPIITPEVPVYQEWWRAFFSLSR